MLTAALALVVAVQSQISFPYLEPTEARLSGITLDENGVPLAGVRVEWRRSKGAEGPRVLARSTSMADGRFQLSIDPDIEVGWWDESLLSLELPGLAPTHIVCLPSGLDNCEIGPVYLYPFAELHGRVVDGEGKPVAGASVHAQQGKSEGPYEDTWARPPVATTDADGRFACRNVPSGLVTLGVSAAGFADLVFEPRSLALRTPNELSAVLQPGRSVTVRVRDGAIGVPLLATCTPLGPGYLDVEGSDETGEARLAFWRAPVVGGLGGQVTLDALPTPFAGGVLVEAKGHAPCIVSLGGGDVAVVLAETLRLDVRATRKGSAERPELVAVEIRDGTHPPSWCGNCEDFNWLKLRVDSPGVERVSPDHWRIEWNALRTRVRGGTPSRVFGVIADGSSSRCDVLPGDSRAEREATLEFEPPYRLIGRVVSPEGQGVALAMSLRPCFDQLRLRFQADSDGRFDVLLGANLSWVDSDDRAWSLPENLFDGEVAPGETRHVEWRLVANRELDRWIRGRVTVAGAQPDRPLLLALEDRQRDRFVATTWTDPEGRFELEAPYCDGFRILSKLPDARGSSWRDLRSEFVDRSTGAGCSVLVDGAPLDELRLDLLSAEAWRTRNAEDR